GMPSAFICLARAADASVADGWTAAARRDNGIGLDMCAAPGGDAVIVVIGESRRRRDKPAVEFTAGLRRAARHVDGAPLAWNWRCRQSTYFVRLSASP